MASQGSAAEEYLQLAREAGAFYLKLSESILREAPGNVRLADAVAGDFTQYAYAFVAFEAERIESKYARAAQKLRERAARLYGRAHGHAMAVLEHRTPGFARALASPDPTRWPVIADEQVGVAYWAAASWGGLTALSKDDPEVVPGELINCRSHRVFCAVLPASLSSTARQDSRNTDHQDRKRQRLRAHRMQNHQVRNIPARLALRTRAPPVLQI